MKYNFENNAAYKLEGEALTVGNKQISVGEYVRTYDSLFGWQTYLLTRLSEDKWGSHLERIDATGKANCNFGICNCDPQTLANNLAFEVDSVVLYSDTEKSQKKTLEEAVNYAKFKDSSIWKKAENFLRDLNETDDCEYSEEMLLCEALKIYAGQMYQKNCVEGKLTYLAACKLADFFTDRDKMYKANKKN